MMLTIHITMVVSFLLLIVGLILDPRIKVFGFKLDDILCNISMVTMGACNVIFNLEVHPYLSIFSVVFLCVYVTTVFNYTMNSDYEMTHLFAIVTSGTVAISLIQFLQSSIHIVEALT